MSKPIERYRQSDVNFWGVAAITASGLALSAASLPALLPNQVFTALHASRLNGADVNNLRAEVATLSDETLQLKLDSAQMLTRLELAEKNRGSIVKRVGALENTLPLLVEQIPPGTPVDASIVTSSVGTLTETSEIPGGSVKVSRTPLYPVDGSDVTDPGTNTPPLPEATTVTTDDGSTEAGAARVTPPDLLRVDTESYGLAMGAAVTVSDAYVTWLDLRNKVGALLIGMEPIISGGNGGYHIVAGPVDRIARAEELCGYVQRAGLQCLPVPYSGYQMPQ